MKAWIGGALLWLVVMVVVSMVAGCSSAGTTSLSEDGTQPALQTQGQPGQVGTVGAPNGPGAAGGLPTLIPSDPVPVPERVLPSAPGTREYRVRLTGDHVGGAKGLFVNVRSLQAWADGAEVPVALETARLDLAFEGNAYLIGRVTVPNAAKAVRFRLELDDYGAFVPKDAKRAGGVDLREVPIEWTSQTDWLKERGHTVVHLDVGRSLTPQKDGWRLLPQLIVLH